MESKKLARIIIDDSALKKAFRLPDEIEIMDFGKKSGFYCGYEMIIEQTKDSPDFCLYKVNTGEEIPYAEIAIYNDKKFAEIKSGANSKFHRDQ